MNQNKTRQLRIGSLELAGRFLLAPLAGISDSSFRRIAKRQGAALVYTEMVSAKALEQNNRNTAELLRMKDEEKPVGVQLFGHEPDVMARATRMLEDYDFALVDINMGCPVPKVVKNGEGSALMKDLELAGEVVRSVRSATDKPVTVKIRTGFEGARISAADFAKILEQAGADAITVHGRRREQYYSGEVDTAAIRSVKEAVSIPVIGNGDVRGAASARRMFDETGCDGLMIGRGAIGDPWIFAELAAMQSGEAFTPPTMEEKGAMLLEQASLSMEEHGEKMGVMRMRGIAGWYFRGIHGAASVRDRIHSASTYEELKQIVADVLRLT